VRFGLKGKSAVIIGGTSGIGLAVAQRFRKAGANVTIGARHQTVDSKAASLRFVRADVSNASSIRKFFRVIGRDVGPVDILVHNAGVSTTDVSDLSKIDIDAYQTTIATNTRGVVLSLKFGTQHVRDGGSVIITSSIAARTPFPGYMLYSSSKAALGPLVEHAAMRLGCRRIRVNAICPGSILTPMQLPDDPEVRVAMVATCLGRAGTTDDVVGAFQFLASDESRYVTATTLNVDGGWIGGLTESALKVLNEYRSASDLS